MNALPLIASCMLAGSLPAQNINVDFQPASSTVGTAPASYAGPASSPGVWNAVTSASSSGLLSTAGAATGVGLSVVTSLPDLSFEQHDFALAPDEALLDDFLRANWSSCDLVFSGLAPGNYAVYTVLLDLGNVFALQVHVPGSPDPDLFVAGNWGGSYVLGSVGSGGLGNYARQSVNVTGGTLSVQIWPSGFFDQVYVQGVQLVRLDPDVLPMCAGDGTLGACPCANSGVGGHGCENSVGTGGGLLGWSGNTVPDTLVLNASGLLPNATSIFLQGTANVAPVAFGDGLRCTGGVLKRLYTKNASSGAVSAPAAGDPSITQRSAALGDAIPIGDRRYYQVYYRDPSAGFCPAPSGGTYNITNSLRVFW